MRQKMEEKSIENISTTANDQNICIEFGEELMALTFWIHVIRVDSTETLNIQFQNSITQNKLTIHGNVF